LVKVKPTHRLLRRSLDFDNLAVSVLESLPDFGQQLLPFIVEIVAEKYAVEASLPQ